MTRDRIGHARQRLAVALTAGHPTVAREQVRRAEITLRSAAVGHADLARRLEGVLVGDVTSAAARAELRAVAEQLDRELAPLGCGFEVASDGGGR